MVHPTGNTQVWITWRPWACPRNFRGLHRLSLMVDIPWSTWQGYCLVHQPCHERVYLWLDDILHLPFSHPPLVCCCFIAPLPSHPLDSEVTGLVDRARSLTNFLWSRKRAPEDVFLRERALSLEKALWKKAQEKGTGDWILEWDRKSVV